MMTSLLLSAVVCPLNWFVGWGLVLTGFASGAAIGMGFHRDDFLGGYDSLRRRMVRLGHIALTALGMMNVLFALSPMRAGTLTTLASACFIAGAVFMPAICFLTAWRTSMRHLFFIPVVTLMAAVCMTLAGGLQ